MSMHAAAVRVRRRLRRVARACLAAPPSSLRSTTTVLTACVVIMLLVLLFVALLALTLAHIGALNRSVDATAAAVPPARSAWEYAHDVVGDIARGALLLWVQHTRGESVPRTSLLHEQQVVDLLAYGVTSGGNGNYYDRVADALVGVHSRVGVSPSTLAKLQEVQHLVDAVRRRVLPRTTRPTRNTTPTSTGGADATRVHNTTRRATPALDEHAMRQLRALAAAIVRMQRRTAQARDVDVDDNMHADELRENATLPDVPLPVSSHGERVGDFVRAAGAAAEVQVLRPFDDVAMLAYRHTLLTLHDTPHRMPASWLRALRQSASVLHRRYYYPRRRWDAASPYTRDFAAATNAWFGAVVLDTAHALGDDAFVVRHLTATVASSYVATAAASSPPLVLPSLVRVSAPSSRQVRHLLARFAQLRVDGTPYNKHNNNHNNDDDDDDEDKDDASMHVPPRRASDAASLFVNFASYRDRECAPTLRDLFDKAAHVHRVFVGVAEQNRPHDPPCVTPALLRPVLCYAPRNALLQQTRDDDGDDDSERQRLQRNALATQRIVAQYTNHSQPHRRSRAYATLRDLAWREVDAATKGNNSDDDATTARGRTHALDFVRGVCFLSDHIRLRRIHASRSFGPTFGRYMAMLLYRGESRVLVLDSHNRFRPHWDSLLMHMHGKYDDSKAVLSHYPEAYVEPTTTTTTTTTTTAPDARAMTPTPVADDNDGQARVVATPSPLSTDDDDDGDDDDDHTTRFRLVRTTTSYMCRAHMLKHLGYVRFESIVIASPAFYARNNQYNLPYVTPPSPATAAAGAGADAHTLAMTTTADHPPPQQQASSSTSSSFRLPQPFVAGGFLFAHGRVAREVAFDPHLPHIFDGEEVLLAVRLWTHGYNLYSPARSVCYHFYGRASAPKVWDDQAATWQVTQDQSRRRIWFLLRTRQRAVDALRVPRDTREAPVLRDVDRYGLGRVRAIAQWYTYAGIDPVTYTIEAKFC